MVRLRAAADLADFGDRSVRDRDVRAQARGAGAVDHGAIFDYEVVCHRGESLLARSEGLSSCIEHARHTASRSVRPVPWVNGRDRGMRSDVAPRAT